MLKDILGEISWKIECWSNKMSDSYERFMEKIDKLKSKHNDAS